MTPADALEADFVFLVLDVFARASTGSHFDTATARAAVAAQADQYAALAEDLRRTVDRLARLSDALDVLDAGELDDARRALRHAVLDPIDRSHP